MGATIPTSMYVCTSTCPKRDTILGAFPAEIAIKKYLRFTFGAGKAKAAKSKDKAVKTMPGS